MTRPALDRPTLDDTAVGPGLLEGRRSAFLIGVEGVGMSGVARMLHARGLRVRGADQAPGVRAEALRSLGIDVGTDHEGNLVPDDVDLVVHSAAIPDVHPQLEAARARGVDTLKYADVLGALMAERTSICVAGCHGKTTTSAMIASALLHAGLDPSFVVGGELTEHGLGAKHGRGPHFVAESCEFDRSFHAHRPTVAIVTNVDEDHLDYYRDLSEIQESFRAFAALIPADGTLVVNDAYASIFRDDARLAGRVVTYGFDEGADWRCLEPEVVGDGLAMEIEYRGSVVRLALPMLGRHNALNATGALAAMVAGGVPLDVACAGLGAFGGVGRRLEFVASCRGIDLLDDYGHHPAEIRAVIRALRRRYGERRLVVVFQPHQASRTRCLMKDFAAALAEADEVWMPPIYFARDSEEERRRVTSSDLARHVGNEGGSATTLDDLPAAIEHAVANLRSGDVLVTMGAGDVDEVVRALATRLR